MPNTHLSDIFKNGDNFKLKEVNFASKKVIREVRKVRKEREAILARKNINWAELEKFHFTV